MFSNHPADYSASGAGVVPDMQAAGGYTPVVAARRGVADKQAAVEGVGRQAQVE